MIIKSVKRMKIDKKTWELREEDDEAPERTCSECRWNIKNSIHNTHFSFLFLFPSPEKNLSPLPPHIFIYSSLYKKKNSMTMTTRRRWRRRRGWYTKKMCTILKKKETAKLHMYIKGEKKTSLVRTRRWIFFSEKR